MAQRKGFQKISPHGNPILAAAKKGDCSALDAAISAPEANMDALTWELNNVFHLSVEAGAANCVQTLIDHGAQKSINAMNSRMFSPLGLAIRTKRSLGQQPPPVRRQLAQTLMSAKADPLIALRSFSNVLNGVDLEAMEMLVEPETIFASPEPIIIAFKIGNQLRRLSMQQPERKLEYERLAGACEKLATDLLSGCRDLWDVRRLLSLTNGSKVLTTAISLRQKTFISHPFTQEFLNELWLREYYGDRSYADWMVAALSYILFFIIVPYRFVTYLMYEKTRVRGVLTYSKLGDLLKIYKTPFFKYTGNVICFMVFVVLILTNSAKHVSLVPSNLEVLLSIWVFALTVGEMREAYRHGRYLADKWNQLDILMIAIFSAVIGIRTYCWNQVDGSDPDEKDAMRLLFASNALHGIGAAIACLRLLNTMQAHRLLGPLQLIVADILRDLSLFLVFLVLFMLSFSAALTKVYEFEQDIPQLSSFQQSIQTLFWVLFGLIELDTFSSGHPDDTISHTTEALGKFLLGTYLVLVSILLINLLIAMMTTTYNRIQVNADIEWKFLRAKLILGYQTSPVIPPPFNLVLEPICWIFSTLFGFTMFSIADDSETRNNDRRMIAKLQAILIQKVKAKHAAAVDVAGRTDRSFKALESQITALSDRLGGQVGAEPTASDTGIADLNVRPRQDSFAGFAGQDEIGFPSSGGSVQSGELDHESLVC